MKIINYIFLALLLFLASCNRNVPMELRLDDGAFSNVNTCMDCGTDNFGTPLARVIVSSNLSVKKLIVEGDIVVKQDIDNGVKIVEFLPDEGAKLCIRTEGCKPLFVPIPGHVATNSEYYIHILYVESKVDNTNSQTIYANGVPIEMITVEGGTFLMGATFEQVGDEYGIAEPVHSVTLSSYKIGKYEVTQRLWKAVMGNNPSEFKGDELPVEQVSWNDVQKFITKLNQITGKRFRLPTEAEWEYAARGGVKSRGYKYSGSDNIGDVAWCEDNSSGKPHAVGSKLPNELGICDMSGNVWEWCQDWYGNYSSDSLSNPTGPISGIFHVYRGGESDYPAWSCLVSTRLDYIADPEIEDLRHDTGFGIGFRLAL